MGDWYSAYNGSNQPGPAGDTHPLACSEYPRRVRLHLAPLALAAFTLVGLGCTAQTEPPAVEEAYVARSSVQLIEDLHPSSPVIGELAMGGRVQIIGRRRSFVRVRDANGLEGWAKSTELITAEVRDQVLQVRDQTRDDPPQGELHALQTLNVHLEPYRWSPTIYQLEPDEGVQMLRHQTVDRLPGPPAEGEPPPTVEEKDDWYLVRLETGRAGWVLATGVYSGIPEEVAQYAERRRIISYFPLGEVYDSASRQTKHTWLWTQSSLRNQPYDFDLLRVFVWSRRRQAYQTIKIERGLRGYLPVTLQEQVHHNRDSGPGFSILVEDRQGQLVRRNYVLARDHIYRISEEPAPPLRAPIRFKSPEPPPPAPPSLFDRLLSRLGFSAQ